MIKLKFELDDIMTTQEAAERWNVTADSLKQKLSGISNKIIIYNGKAK